jgi:hypothetical protein
MFKTSNLRRYYRTVLSDDMWLWSHPPSVSQSYCVATVDDLIRSFKVGRLAPADYLRMLHRRRRLFRGSRELAGACYPLSNYNPEKVLSFTSAELLGTEFEAALYKSGCMDGSLPLRGLVFSSKAPIKTTADASLRVFEASLEAAGAVKWGTSTAPYGHVSPVTALPHPLEPTLAVGGSSGGGAFGVACGLSSFSIGTNGGGSNIIPAGLLGLAGFHFGDTKALGVPHLEAFSEVVARTPSCVARIYGALLRRSHDEIAKSIRHAPASARILAVADLPQPANSWSNAMVPIENGKVLGPASLHADVRRFFADSMSTLKSMSSDSFQVHVADDAYTSESALCDASFIFMTLWLRQCVQLSADATHDGAGSAEDLVPHPDHVNDLFTEPASKWLATAPDDFDARVSRAREFKATNAQDSNKCKKLADFDYLLTPLLRIPYFEKGAHPTLTTTHGRVFDPSSNPFTIIANLAATASITIPSSITTKCPDGRVVHLPYALVLTSLRQLDSDGLIKFLATANYVAYALQGKQLPPYYFKNAYEGAETVDDSIRAVWPKCAAEAYPGVLPVI